VAAREGDLKMMELLIRARTALCNHHLCPVSTSSNALVGVQILAELSSEDALWRRFCPSDSAEGTTAGVDGFLGGNEKRHGMKDKYMDWLRTNLNLCVQSPRLTCCSTLTLARR
jgi:hypothetical protein